MSSSFTPRTSDTRSFYSSRSRNNRRAGSAAQRIQRLGREIRSYAAGEDILEHVSVPLTENDEEINEDDSNFGLPLHPTSTQESSMFIFQTPTTSDLVPVQRRPLTSSRFNSSTSQQLCNHSDPPSHSLDVTQLLQQQQVTLMKVLKQQEELQLAQKDFSQRIQVIEEQVQAIARSSTTPSSSSPSTPVSTPKAPKRRVPRSLSVSYVPLLTDIYYSFHSLVPSPLSRTRREGVWPNVYRARVARATYSARQSDARIKSHDCAGTTGMHINDCARARSYGM